MKKLPKYCPKPRLMQHSACHEHDNHMVLGIVCCLFSVFYVCRCAFMEEGECRHTVSLVLENEFACSS